MRRISRREFLRIVTTVKDREYLLDTSRATAVKTVAGVRSVEPF